VIRFRKVTREEELKREGTHLPLSLERERAGVRVIGT
jgi:hypothetical protein